MVSNYKIENKIIYPLSLRNKRKLRFFYYLYSDDHEAVRKAAAKLGFSASEMVHYLINMKLSDVVRVFEKR